jgi:hypothetical protein
MKTLFDAIAFAIYLCGIYAAVVFVHVLTS